MKGSAVRRRPWFGRLGKQFGELEHERFLDRLLVERGELGQWFGSYRISRFDG